MNGSERNKAHRREVILSGHNVVDADNCRKHVRANYFFAQWNKLIDLSGIGDTRHCEAAGRGSPS